MNAYRYSVPYRRIDAPTSRVFHRTVTARTADEARQLVKIADPAFLATVHPGPRRGAQVQATATLPPTDQ